MRQGKQNTYKHGQWNVLCQVCGFKYKSSDIKKRWDGLYVCEEDWEARHPADFFRGTKEDPSVPFVRPEDAGQQANGANTDIGGNTFPNAENTTATSEGEHVDTNDNGYVDNGTFSTDDGTI